MLESHHPAFSCPLCRTFADLEEDVEVEIEYEEDFEEVAASDKELTGQCEVDIDVEASDDQGHVSSSHNQPGSDDVPRSRSNSRLELRSAEREAGAETEVEGEGSSMGIVSRSRARRGAHSSGGGGGGDRASPLVDLTDEPGEEMAIDISQSLSGGEVGVVVVGGDADEAMDMDATVGAGKRKR